MPRPRMTIAGLLGIIAGVGVAIAALRAATAVWDSVLFGLVWVALLTSVLLAVHRTGKQRAGWLGFALLGWAYVVSSLVPGMAARLPTTRLLIAIWNTTTPVSTATTTFLIDQQLFAGAPDVLYFPNQPLNLVVSTNTASWFAPVNQPGPGNATGREVGSFLQIGHSLWALVAAFSGYLLSRALYRAGHALPAQESGQIVGIDEVGPECSGDDFAKI